MTLIVSLPPCPGATAWDGLPGHGGATACTHLVRRRSLPFTKGRVADWRSQADGWGTLPERAPPVSLLTQRATLPASRRRDKRSIAGSSLYRQEMCECGSPRARRWCGNPAPPYLQNVLAFAVQAPKPPATML